MFVSFHTADDIQIFVADTAREAVSLLIADLGDQDDYAASDDGESIVENVENHTLVTARLHQNIEDFIEGELDHYDGELVERLPATLRGLARAIEEYRAREANRSVIGIDATMRLAAVTKLRSLADQIYDQGTTLNTFIYYVFTDGTVIDSEHVGRPWYRRDPDCVVIGKITGDDTWGTDDTSRVMLAEALDRMIAIITKLPDGWFEDESEKAAA